MTGARTRALHGLLSLGGGVLLAVVWKKHPIIGFFLGSSLGFGAATLVTGVNPLEQLPVLATGVAANREEERKLREDADRARIAENIRKGVIA